MSEEPKWYYRPWAIAAAIFCFGPLGLILLWFRPRTRLSVKVLVSGLVVGLTVWMTIGVTDYYRTMIEHIKEVSGSYGGA